MSGALALRRGVMAKPITPPAAGYVAEVDADSPTAHWRLGETSGTAADDRVGSNDGTYVNTPTLGVTGALASDADKAVTFTAASSEYVALPALAIGTTGSWEFWINGAGGADGWAVGEFHSGTGAYIGIGFSGGRLTCTIFDGASFTSFDGPFGKDDGAWHHVVLTKATLACVLYVDASSVASPTLPGSVTTNSSDIGRLPQPSSYLTGSVDEVALYSTALSSGRVSAHRTAGIT